MITTILWGHSYYDYLLHRILHKVRNQQRHCPSVGGCSFVRTLAAGPAHADKNLADRIRPPRIIGAHTGTIRDDRGSSGASTRGL